MKGVQAITPFEKIRIRVGQVRVPPDPASGGAKPQVFIGHGLDGLEQGRDHDIGDRESPVHIVALIGQRRSSCLEHLANQRPVSGLSVQRESVLASKEPRAHGSNRCKGARNAAWHHAGGCLFERDGILQDPLGHPNAHVLEGTLDLVAPALSLGRVDEKRIPDAHLVGIAHNLKGIAQCDALPEE